MTRWVPTKREEKYGVGEDAPAPLPPVAHGAPPGRGLPVPGRLRAALRGRDGARCSPLPSGSCLPRPAPPGSQELEELCASAVPRCEKLRVSLPERPSPELLRAHFALRGERSPCPVCRPSVGCGSVMFIQMRAFPARWDPFPSALLPSRTEGDCSRLLPRTSPLAPSSPNAPSSGQGCAHRAPHEPRDVWSKWFDFGVAAHRTLLA